MKTIITTLMLAFILVADALAQQGSGVYVGGHIRRARPATITTLKNSGFTYVILFNVTVEADGTLTTDGETICKDGAYVFDQTQPHYVDDVKALKAWPTSIQRIEICIGGWGNESYTHIRDLVQRDGTGEHTILYRNFKALKTVLPEIDAVNNDDEHCYDVTTAAAFHAMMHRLGYLTTVAPYTNKTFWTDFVATLHRQQPGSCDRVLVQCYDGGANNRPADWQLGDASLHAGRTNYQSDMSTSIAQMQRWHDEAGVVGGFVWVYNDETWNLNQWAAAINRVFQPRTASDGVVTLYSENNYGGYAVELPEGSYATGELALWGIADKDIASFRLQTGYRLTGYANSDLTGASREWADSQLPRMSAWANRISSLKIEKISTDALPSVKADSPGAPVYFDLQGRRLHDRPASGLYIEKRNATVRKHISQ